MTKNKSKNGKNKSQKVSSEENTKIQNQANNFTKKDDIDENTTISSINDTTANDTRFSRYKNLYFKYRKYTDTIFMRVLFITIFSLHIYYLACIYDNRAFYILYLSSPIIILDGFYILFKRHGHDYYW